jgi:hypothetical protein
VFTEPTGDLLSSQVNEVRLDVRIVEARQTSRGQDALSHSRPTDPFGGGARITLRLPLLAGSATLNLSSLARVPFPELAGPRLRYRGRVGAPIGGHFMLFGYPIGEEDP